MFLLQQCAEKFSLKMCTSTKSFSSMDNCLRHCFPGAPDWWLSSCRVYSQCIGGWIPLGSLGLWCLISRLSQNHFRSWIHTEFWFLVMEEGWRQKQGMFYAAMVHTLILFSFLSPQINFPVHELYKSTQSLIYGFYPSI